MYNANYRDYWKKKMIELITILRSLMIFCIEDMEDHNPEKSF